MNQQQKQDALDMVQAYREWQVDQFQEAERQHRRAHADLRTQYLQQQLEREQAMQDMIVIPPEPIRPIREPGPEVPAHLDPSNPWEYDAKAAFRASQGIQYE